MQWTSVISRKDRASEALADVIEQTWQRIEHAPDLVIVFASRHHASAVAEIPATLSRAFGDATVIGCLAESVIGAGEEEEGQPSISVTAACLPGVDVRLRHVPHGRDLRNLEDLGDDVQAIMVVLDRYTTDPRTLVEALDDRFPDAEKFGGLASAGAYPGSNVIFAGDRALREGAAVLAFGGNVAVDTIVAQGCRPIGPNLAVEEHLDNVILRFDQGLPQQVLEDIYQSLPPEDQRHMPAALHIGVRLRRPSIDGREQFIIRPILGVDPNSGALTAGLRIEAGDVVRFQLRDPHSSSGDLRMCIDQFRGDAPPAPRGALLFTCIERGEQLFGQTNHDSTMFREAFGDLPLGGFFCAGEFGMVGGRTLLHYYTSAFALFRPRDEP